MATLSKLLKSFNTVNPKITWELNIKSKYCYGVKTTDLLCRGALVQYDCYAFVFKTVSQPTNQSLKTDL